MKYLLDTNVLIARLNGHPKVAARLREIAAPDIVIAAPVLAELEYGAWNSRRREENLERLRRLVAHLGFESFGRESAQTFGRLKAELRSKGIAKSDIDLMLASMALSLEIVLVSDDRAFHDGEVDGLRVENWLT